MEKLLLLILLFNTCLISNAQFSGASSNIGHIYGKIIDSATGKPISDASVFILQNRFDSISKTKKEILISGLSTRKNGDFSFSDLPIMGALTLKISALGFTSREQKVAFDLSGGMTGLDKDLGNIGIKENATELQAVTVTASRPTMKMDIDKKVFYVDQNIVSAGGTALDVMKNVPSVQVDINGGVKLRNAAPQIYVDGRPTTLSLDQIPADAIEKVEVITNPSAKYDASGGNAGILNVVLKKNRKSGYNGFMMAGADSRGGMNALGNFNLRQNKFNFTATVFGSQIRNKATGNTERLNLLSNPNILVSQENISKTKGGFIFGRLGMDYFLSNRTTLSVSGMKVSGKFKPNEIISISSDTLFNTNAISSKSSRTSNSSTEFNSTGFQAGFKHNFQHDGEELTADFNYNGTTTNGDGLFTSQYYGTSSTVKNLTRQNVTWDGKTKFITLQADYVKPLREKMKLETGVRMQLNRVTNDNNTYYQAASGSDFILLPNASSNFDNNNDVYAAYGTFTHSIKDFGYQVGLRAESSTYTGKISSTGEKFGNDYPVSLFPSIFLSQKLKNDQELQLSYTRRITRPGFMQLMPFTNYTDSLNITRGNPDLVPSFTNSLETSYSKTFNKQNNLLFSVYYKYSTDLITQYLEKQINAVTGREDIINTYINANSSYSAGAEITSINKPTKWLDITTNINIYNSKINAGNQAGASQDARWSWFGKLNTNWKLPAKFTVQVSGNYQSKTNLPIGGGGQSFDFGNSQAQSTAQGYTNPYWAVDMAVKKTFMKNDAAAIALSVSDIFRTRKIEQHSESPFFIQDYSRLTNPQLVRLTLTFRFGKFDTSLFKRKNSKSDDPMQSGMQGIQ